MDKLKSSAVDLFGNCLFNLWNTWVDKSKST